MSAGGSARIWDSLTGRLVRDLPAPGDLGSVAFSADGRLLLSRGWLFSVVASVWSVATGRSVAVLRGHTASIKSALFSSDGRFVVTASSDGTARIWSADNGTLMMILTGHTAAEGVRAPAMTGFDARRIGPMPSAGSVNSAVFGPDGQRVVTAGRDGTAQVYRCEVCGTLADLLDVAAHRVTRGLTQEERERYLHVPQ